MSLQPGIRLGHYTVSALIGEGGMGHVWQGGSQVEPASGRVDRWRPSRRATADTDFLLKSSVTLIQGRQQSLWRAVDEDGDTMDILVPSRRNRRAALRFFRKLLKAQGCVPRHLITDKLRSYPAACRTVMPSARTSTPTIGPMYLTNRPVSASGSAAICSGPSIIASSGRSLPAQP